MKNRPTKICLLLSAMGIAQVSFGQLDDNAAYAAFDKTIQTKNAAYNNGKIHFNRFQSADKTHRYYKSSDFVIGDLIFDGQRYTGLFLKYDVLADELVVKFDGEGNKMGFSPVKKRVDVFYIGGVKFVNLDLTRYPNFTSGFYEEAVIGSVSLYVKHRKNQITSLNAEKVLYTYVDDFRYFIKHENEFYPIETRRDVITAFPSLEPQITDFFDNNTALEKADRQQFMKKLVFRLGELFNTAEQ